METSENINELAAALSKAQGKITGALKDSSNPFFKSKYADLASCWEACRAALSENNLAVIQTVRVNSDAGAPCVLVTTMLAHASGQWVRDTLSLFPKDTGPQAFGSCITYGRRYGMTAIIGLAQVDDDAETAGGRLPIDPRGEAQYSKADHKKAQEYADRFRKAMVEGKEDQLYELHQECNPDASFYILVSTKLSAPERTSIKESIHRVHETHKANGVRQ